MAQLGYLSLLLSATGPVHRRSLHCCARYFNVKNFVVHSSLTVVSVTNGSSVPLIGNSLLPGRIAFVSAGRDDLKKENSQKKSEKFYFDFDIFNTDRILSKCQAQESCDERCCLVDQQSAPALAGGHLTVSS